MLSRAILAVHAFLPRQKFGCDLAVHNSSTSAAQVLLGTVARLPDALWVYLLLHTDAQQPTNSPDSKLSRVSTFSGKSNKAAMETFIGFLPAHVQGERLLRMACSFTPSLCLPALCSSSSSRHILQARVGVLRHQHPNYADFYIPSHRLGVSAQNIRSAP